jgi:hypothetical protein
MSPYERVIRSFMTQRGVKSVAELHRRVVAQGHDVSYKRVYGNLKAHWAGRMRDPRVNLATARALGLDEREMMQVARANLEL